MAKKKEDPLREKSWSWRPGSRHKIKPEVAGKEIERLSEKNGNRIDAELVVDAAASPSNPLHPEFEWDDTKAAHEHRLCQSRNLLNSVLITYTTTSDEPITTTFMVTLQKDEGRAGQLDYSPTHIVMADKDGRAEVLARAKGELEAFRRKYKHLTELRGIFEAMDQTFG